jgi:peptidoglycan/LPS O-acetylase OafA/YrhL
MRFSHGSSQQLDEITGLRAIAVLSVVLFHFNADLLPGGYLGVDVFFVISGFVITRSLVRTKESGFGRYILQFYSRRLKRLIPALAIVVIVGALLTAFFHPDPEESIYTGMAAMFGLSNILLAINAQDYFSIASEFNTFTHTWSLGVEEQYYFIFPVVLYFFLGAINRGQKYVAIGFLALLGILSLLVFDYLIVRNPTFGFYLMPARFWELAAGCILCLAEINLKKRSGTAVALIGLALLCFSFSLPEEAARVATPLAVLGTCGLIMGTNQSGFLRVALTNKAFLWIGLASYSIYLWHWPILVTSRWTIGISLATFIPQIVTIFGLAAISYHYVERPLRYARWSVYPGRTVQLGFGMASAAAALVYLMWNPFGGMLALGSPKSENQLYQSQLIARQDETIVAARELAQSCNITPHHLAGHQYAPKPVLDEEFLDRCLVSSAQRSRMILIGDSFAGSSIEHVAAIADEMNREFGVLYGFSCPFPLPFSDVQGKIRGTCTEADDTWLSQEVVERVGANDIVVLRLFFTNPAYLGSYSTDFPPTDAYDVALNNFSKKISDKGGRLVVIGGNPKLSVFDIPSLTHQWYNTFGIAESFASDTTKESEFFHELDNHLLDRFDGDPLVNYLSIAKWFCDSDRNCLLRQGPAVYYWNDGVHLTPIAYDRFFDALREHLFEIGDMNS